MDGIQYNKVSFLDNKGMKSERKHNPGWNLFLLSPQVKGRLFSIIRTRKVSF